jgi:hypothetical protein
LLRQKIRLELERRWPPTPNPTGKGTPSIPHTTRRSVRSGGWRARSSIHQFSRPNVSEGIAGARAVAVTSPFVRARRTWRDAATPQAIQFRNSRRDGAASRGREVALTSRRAGRACAMICKFTSSVIGARRVGYWRNGSRQCR